MIRQSYAFEIITPCFAGGANPDVEAEIRAASIRGQLRWWSRVLGGFQSLAPRMNLRKQEDFIFGAIAGDDGHAGALMVRVRGSSLSSENRKNAKDLTQNNRDNPKGYLLFPLRERDDKDGRKGVFYAESGSHGSFILQLQWASNTLIEADIRALITVFGNLGSLGFRSRRAMGALRLAHAPLSLKEASEKFTSPSSIIVFGKDVTSEDNSIRMLATWLRSWRQHGQMFRIWDWDPANRPHGKKWFPIDPATQKATRDQVGTNREQPGFRYARRDHNEGLDVQGTGALAPDPENPHGAAGTTFRPALGLPIIQYFSSLENRRGEQLNRLHATVNWGYSASGGGRFASPILLRPHFDGTNWRALVIVVEAMKWPNDPNTHRPRNVHLSSNRGDDVREVSLSLYEAMKDSLQSDSGWCKLF